MTLNNHIISTIKYTSYPVPKLMQQLFFYLKFVVLIYVNKVKDIIRETIYIHVSFIKNNI